MSSKTAATFEEFFRILRAFQLRFPKLFLRVQLEPPLPKGYCHVVDAMSFLKQNMFGNLLMNQMSKPMVGWCVMLQIELIQSTSLL